MPVEGYYPKFHLVVEGQTDRVVLSKILRERAHISEHEIVTYVKDGKSALLAKLSSYNQAARFYSRWLVVLDPDQGANCAPQYVNDLLPSPAPGLELRIAVRSIEAWLMADRSKLAQFLGIAADNFPRNPDAEQDPKRFLIDLVRRKCRFRHIRQDIIPAERSGRRVGPGYLTQVSRFALQYWRPEFAAEHSDSLARCLRALNRWSK